MAVHSLAAQGKNEKKLFIFLKKSVNIPPHKRKQCLGNTQITLTVY